MPEPENGSTPETHRPERLIDPAAPEPTQEDTSQQAASAASSPDHSEGDEAPTDSTTEPQETQDRRGPIGWRELVRDFVKPGRAQVIFAAILLVCGLGVAMQVRTQAQETDYSTMRRADLVQLLDDLNAESRRLEGEIAELEETKRQLQGGADRERVAREQAQRRLDVLAILGGTAPAQGPGIRITIYDPNRKVTPELLLNTVEELRDAGAEVIAINNTIRVVASTSFAAGPNGIMVDNQLVTAPISIDVIGEPHALTESTRFSGGLTSEVQGSRIGGSVSVVTDEKLTITAVVNPPVNRFAKPA